jgi:hypothetical protein
LTPAPGINFSPRSSALENRNQMALNRSAPGKSSVEGLFAQYNQSLMANLGTSGVNGGRGKPLDMDQWQMGRTAQIHVHNEHPSIRMEVAAMG